MGVGELFEQLVYSNCVFVLAFVVFAVLRLCIVSYCQYIIHSLTARNCLS